MQLRQAISKTTLAWLIMLSLFFSGLHTTIPHAHADTAAVTTDKNLPVKSLAFSQGISDWLADWDAGYMYAVSSSTNKLYFIRAADLSIQKEIVVGSQPVSIARNGNTLFVALSGATLIQPVDLISQTLLTPIAINVHPISVAATSDYLFYGTSNWESYAYNRSNGTNVKINTSQFGAVFAADESKHILYVGETGTSGSKLSAFNYLTNTLVSSSNYNGGYGFAYPNSKLFFDGNNVFFGGSKLNAGDLTEINGAYKRYGGYSYLISKILDVNGNYVLTSQSVFNKETGVKLADLPYEISSGLLGSSGTVYVYDSSYSHNSIEAFQLDLSHSYAMQSSSYGSYVKMSDPISSWTTDDSSPYLYVVSKATNELLVIRKSDMSIVKQQVVGANPTDIKLQNDKLFIALKGETHIVVADTIYETGGATQIVRYSLGSNPDFVYPANNLIYYWSQDSVGEMRVYDSVYGTNRSLADKSLPMKFNSGGAFYDTVTSAIYGVGNVYYSNSIFKITPTTPLTGEAIFPLNSLEYSGKLLKDENEFFYGNKRYSVTGVVYGTYPDSVLYAKGSLVFGQKAIYDRNTFLKLEDLPFPITGAFVGGDGQIFLSTKLGIYRFSSLSDINSFIHTQLLPKKPFLWDDDTQENRISGHIYMKPAGDKDSISRYQINFLDLNQKPVGYMNIMNVTTLADGTLDFKLNNNSVPEEAVSLGVFSYVKVDDSESIINTPVVFPLWDTPTYLPNQVTLTADKDVSGEFKGTLQWKPAKKETAGTIYRVYYINDDSTFGTPLVEVAVGKAAYSLQLDLKQVPNSAYGIAIVVETPDGRQANYIYPKFFSRYTTPNPATESITLVKNATSNDTVTVNGLQAGDRIRVYNANLSLIGQAIAGTGANSVTVSIINFGLPGETLYVTKQNIGKTESTPTQVIVPPIKAGGGGSRE
ncbi:YncE family protein, partial [Paenibacillus sp. N3.4]|uniref:YncE family protein n=1 Tax=Paenibacillus sp. N3.4 TaxID=2603222 RepID=UPI0011D7D56E